MAEPKPRIREVIVVEGRYDKNALSQVVDALIFETGSLKETTLAALRDEQFRLIEVPYRPTAENFARAFYEALKTEELPVLRVTVWETPENCAGYEV